MRRFLPIYTGMLIGVAAVSFAPVQASAASWSDTTSWLSQLFNWQTPTVRHFSSLFEAREDNVQDNSAQRLQLLERRHAAATSTATTSLIEYFAASTSPSTISADLFEGKKTAVVAELGAAVNGLKTGRANLADFIAHSASNGDDMDSAEDALVQADTDIGSAVDAVAVLADYEPTPDGSGLVDLTEAQSDLDAAIAAIQTARDSLKSAIAAAGDSLQ